MNTKKLESIEEKLERTEEELVTTLIFVHSSAERFFISAVPMVLKIYEFREIRIVSQK